jgi:hypothetical protein
MVGSDVVCGYLVGIGKVDVSQEVVYGKTVGIRG